MWTFSTRRKKNPNKTNENKTKNTLASEEAEKRIQNRMKDRNHEEYKQYLKNLEVTFNNPKSKFIYYKKVPNNFGRNENEKEHMRAYLNAFKRKTAKNKMMQNKMRQNKMMQNKNLLNMSSPPKSNIIDKAFESLVRNSSPRLQNRKLPKNLNTVNSLLGIN